MVIIEKAAVFLRVPVATVRYWRYTGDGPFNFKVQGNLGRQWSWTSDPATPRHGPPGRPGVGEAKLSCGLLRTTRGLVGP